METESLSDLFRRLDARNRENVALAGLGIRTSADIFEATQNQYEHSSGQRIAAYGGTVDRLIRPLHENEMGLIGIPRPEGDSQDVDDDSGHYFDWY
ncbi:hypothetical protein Forpe1208_v012275 [Fusarium oxysporum f. sp. rapae]|uniref:Uncharacterized protein n=1 Tax=Fusarium oxysporum f. sp. rapae TaxID=485398 RepID=A0A8J5U3I5_FUSOX|nr:hypothetical protein Forpe1208_v012275 [Fusarium oxysporum f. sp. rapae]